MEAKIKKGHVYHVQVKRQIVYIDFKICPWLNYFEQKCGLFYYWNFLVYKFLLSRKMDENAINSI